MEVTRLAGIIERLTGANDDDMEVSRVRHDGFCIIYAKSLVMLYTVVAQNVREKGSIRSQNWI